MKSIKKYGLTQSAEAVFDSLYGNREWLRLIPKFSISSWGEEALRIELQSVGRP